MKRWLLLLVLLFSFSALAQQELEIIPLQHRAVEQVLPVIRPFVEAGGMVSGMNNQIILRASRKNLEQIREIIANLDTPPRRLMISVSSDISQESARQGAAVAGRIELGEGGGTRIRGRVYDTLSSTSRSGNQHIQVVEGGSGYIAMGRSVPVPMRQVVLGPGGAIVSEGVVYRDIGSGFHAVPRVAGDTVTLEISPQFDAQERGAPGAATIQRLSTTVSGRLGEWIELGGSVQEEDSRERGYTSYGAGSQRDNRRVWLKVDEIK
ncbi:hypothetical protein SKTS_17570 [Sulfurimicrobium lacus]|uniref:NolW-like domain-containing protein n=1 Tax=Sulfurimicrobium lacus TaxID=2715678 RepID=A0A6F8VCK3_9PROT|nr:secretin N-terminal domain-containing protein [Sulfurimicrobium lacus]BCB26871.1 hypothetical protein SKTS_17570 [Sulfurimicrobium lacus]